MDILVDRVALVTGAGRGIGRAIATRLAEAGATVFASDIDVARAEETAQAIVAAGGTAHALLHDVTSEEAWAEIIARIESVSGALDVLVNNAGLTLAKFVEDTTLEDWRLLMRVNLESQFIGVKAALPLMKESAKRTPFGGSIVNMSSVSGIVGTPVLAAYTTSKAGVRYFSKSIALDFGKRGYRIRVNSIHPGITEGESANALFRSRVDAGLSPDLAQAEMDWVANYPLGRVGRALDVANAALFLASDLSAYTTGSELMVDGGLSAQ